MTSYLWDDRALKPNGAWLCKALLENISTLMNWWTASAPTCPCSKPSDITYVAYFEVDLCWCERMRVLCIVREVFDYVIILSSKANCCNTCDCCQLIYLPVSSDLCVQTYVFIQSVWRDAHFTDITREVSSSFLSKSCGYIWWVWKQN